MYYLILHIINIPAPPPLKITQLRPLLVNVIRIRRKAVANKIVDPKINKSHWINNIG